MADEYVLGLLDPAEAKAFEMLLPGDSDLQRALAAAQDRLLEFDLAEEPIEPSAALWARIESNLSRRATGLPGRGVRPRLHASADERRGVNHWWRPAAITGLAASLLLAALLGWRLLFVPEPTVIAVLLDEEGSPVALVEDFDDARTRVTPLTDIDLPPGRAMEVWTLPDRNAEPVSLGLLRQNSGTTLQAPDLPIPTPDQLYEITIEAQEGSPTGGPTGPIIGKGFARVPR